MKKKTVHDGPVLGKKREFVVTVPPLRAKIRASSKRLAKRWFTLVMFRVGKADQYVKVREIRFSRKAHLK